MSLKKKKKIYKPHSCIWWFAFLALQSWLISQNNNYIWAYQRDPGSFLYNRENVNLQEKEIEIVPPKQALS